MTIEETWPREYIPMTYRWRSAWHGIFFCVFWNFFRSFCFPFYLTRYFFQQKRNANGEILNIVCGEIDRQWEKWDAVGLSLSLHWAKQVGLSVFNKIYLIYIVIYVFKNQMTPVSMRNENFFNDLIENERSKNAKKRNIHTENESYVIKLTWPIKLILEVPMRRCYWNNISWYLLRLTNSHVNVKKFPLFKNFSSESENSDAILHIFNPRECNLK